jgi:hypothetical protein
MNGVTPWGEIPEEPGGPVSYNKTSGLMIFDWGDHDGETFFRVSFTGLKLI